MEKKLFRVKVTLYVMGENESEARFNATQACFDIFECSAKKADRIENGWEDAIPYGSDGQHTCAEILAIQKLAIQGFAALTPVTAQKKPGNWPSLAVQSRQALNLT